MTEPWQRVMKRVAARTRLSFDAGRDVCDGVRGRLLPRAALHVARWHAHSRPSRSRRLRRVRVQADARRWRTRPRSSGARCRVEGAHHERAEPTSFYYSFLALPADKRNAIIAVWDFCRAVDDAVDEPGEGDPVVGACAVARGGRGACTEGGEPATPQGGTWRPFIAKFTLPRSAFEDLIDGVAMDLQRKRYDDVRGAAAGTACAWPRPSG